MYVLSQKPKKKKKQTCSFHLYTLGRLHGSSKSHCERKNTSNKPINSINEPPPHVEASVGPIGAPTGQSQSAISANENQKKTKTTNYHH